MNVQDHLSRDVTCYWPGRTTCFEALFNEGLVLKILFTWGLRFTTAYWKN